MPTRVRKRQTPEHAHLAIALIGWSASVAGRINHEIQDRRWRHDGTPVFAYDTSLELDGVCVSADQPPNVRYGITVCGRELSYREFSMTLRDCHVRNEDGSLQYKRVRGKEQPVYRIPEGVGTLERAGGEHTWAGWAWLEPRIVADMLTLLSSESMLYVALHELRIGRTRWIRGIDLQTKHPDIE